MLSNALLTHSKPIGAFAIQAARRHFEAPWYARVPPTASTAPPSSHQNSHRAFDTGTTDQGTCSMVRIYGTSVRHTVHVCLLRTGLVLSVL
eukprot:COSAG02_NODE_6552_length_3500_cov_56.166422_3_plen_91_part_00